MIHSFSPGYYADIIEEAALWESLAQNHPFIDGNKRTAFPAAYTFLTTADGEATCRFIAALHENNDFTFLQLT